MNSEQKNMIQWNLNVLKDTVNNVDHILGMDELEDFRTHIRLIESILAEIK
jgi:hypothetical protein